MVSPDGFPSPSEQRSPVTMAIEDSPAEAADVPIPTEVATPSERSRSDVRERSLAERRTVQSGVVASHRGFEPFASREGLPQNPNHPGGSATMNQAVLLQQLQQIQNNQMTVNTHDPHVTQLVEEVAESRHREAMIETESRVNQMVSELGARVRAEEASAREQMRSMMHQAESRENAQKGYFLEQSEEYKRVLDNHLRQSVATKDLQMNEMRDQFRVHSERKDQQVAKLEAIIQAQSEQIKMQHQHAESMSSQFNKVVQEMRTINSPIVEAPTTTLPATTEVKVSATLPNANLVSPASPLNLVSPAAVHHDIGTPKEAGPIPPAHSPTSYAPSLDAGWTAIQAGVPGGTMYVPPGGRGGGTPGGGGGGGDDDDFTGGRDTPFEMRSNRGGRKGAPGGGGAPPGGEPHGDGDGGDDPDDEERRFLRRLRQVFSMPIGSNDRSDKRIKESDSIKLPAFPQAEQYRNWRIKTREAVMAASVDPDRAFEWISETWTEGRTINQLRSVGDFATLDAKLLSAVTNILTGDFARKVDTYKETEAAQGRYVRGRQVLFMLHEFLSTNIKHGATYALQDLFSVKLKGENLRAFIANWDQVIAGIKNVPDETVLETLFFNQVKNNRSIAHDLQEYHRAEEGTEKKSYTFLITAVRRFLDRERLESNRERVARTLGAASSSAVPALDKTAGYIPKGYCRAWNREGCNDPNCKYKHQAPPPKKERDRKPSRTNSPRARSPSRGRDKKKPCKFWAIGRCTRGSDCKFSHEGTPKSPRAATPARPSSSDSKGGKGKKGSRSPGRRGDKSPRGKGSKSPRNSRSPKGGKSPKASPAAVCLIASLLASVSEAYVMPKMVVSCPSIVRFNEQADIVKISAQGDLRPVGHAKRIFKDQYPWEHKFQFEPQDVEDAQLSAKMLQGAVKSELSGCTARCNFKCNTDFGCNHCIPKSMVAAPAQAEELVNDALIAPIDWIADTGSAQDLLTDHNLPDQYGYYSSCPIRLVTANGESTSTKQGKVIVPELNTTVKPYLVQSTPPVLSVGLRCVDEGFDFIWRGSLRENPYMVRPDGKMIQLEVRDYVPYLCSKTTGADHVATVAVNDVNKPEFRAKVLTPVISDEEVPNAEITDDPLDQDIVPEIIGDPGADAPPPVLPSNEDDGIAEGPERSEEPEADDADREVEPDGEVAPAEPEEPGDDRKRDLGKQALIREAASAEHMLTHVPKNPYCEVCNRAKMFKPVARANGGSSQIQCENFGQHMTGDFLVTRSEPEIGIDGDKVALVMKDVHSDFKYVYPTARRNGPNAVLAFKHFVGPEDEVGVFYSDNAPELKAAARVMTWRHVISRDYISSSNAVAERAIRSVLEGTRVNLLQAGLNHGYWPYAARHWCMMQNVSCIQGVTPWKIRFGEDFKGPKIPFGCQIEYWTGPRKRPKAPLKFQPTSNAGVFLGYVIHPGFLWRNEFAVASLQDLNKSEFEGSVTILRVLKVEIPKEIVFPCKPKYEQHRLGRIEDGTASSGEGLDDRAELKDALPEREPGPIKRKVGDIEAGRPAQSSSASAVYHPGWLEFFSNVHQREGWYEFAQCKVNVAFFQSNAIGPNETFSAEQYPFRTMCADIDEAWHFVEANLKIDPPVEDLTKEVDVCITMVTIFSKEEIDLTSRPAEAVVPQAEVDEIEVYNQNTGLKEKIRVDDPQYYSAGGFKARRYKGSSKPKDIPPFVWASSSVKERRKAIEEEQKKLARIEAEKKRASRAASALTRLEMNNSSVPSIINQLSEVISIEDIIPAMPVCKMNPQKHRVKCVRVGIRSGERIVNTLVARPVGKKEIRSNPKAQEALDVEWQKLVKKTAWQYDTVAEWKDICDKAKKQNKKVHVGKVFEICVEKGSELPEGDKLRKFKGRTVFQGNNVKDENSDVALFSELGSSPATMEAGKAIDAYGSQPGYITEQNDGVQAYTQALMKGIETWVEIPPDRWPKEWKGKYIRPVCKLRIALYGHPDSGGLWELHCESMLIAVGFIMPDPEGWPSVFFHPELKLLLVVYVDDFKMSGPKENMPKGWDLIASKIDMDKPGEVNRYLGCDHKVTHNVKLSVNDHRYAHIFDKSIADPTATSAVAMHRTQDFWELDTENNVYIRHHCCPRKKLYVPDDNIAQSCELSEHRFTVARTPGGDAFEKWDKMLHHAGGTEGCKLPDSWTGQTCFFPKNCDPIAAMASVKRDKTGAKKKARAEGFSYMDQLCEDQPCMQKPVTVFTYDMEPFLKSCVDRYNTLAGKDAKPLKHVATPFYEERIARPVADEKETKGVLAPIAARVLMKILFAARMARYDLLRAVQGLAARVTKWSQDCDKALHRLVCYINSTLKYKQKAFIGDPINLCRLWLFADADHAGEYDSRSTSGCLLVLVGPNTYFPLTAFSKKQTSVSMSSTEAEVVSANVSLRAVGLPSSGLWSYLQQAGGVQKPCIPGGLPDNDVETAKEPNGEHWIFQRSRRLLIRVHTKPRNHMFSPENSMKSSPIPVKRIGYGRTTIFYIDGMVDFKRDNWKTMGEMALPFSWIGRTFFRVYGPYENDYNCESVEIREAITDYEFVGKEKEGESMISLYAPHSIKGVFIEDNQATIRILENGKSPTFRHTDKTQRVNLSWLEEQFKRRWYKLVHGPTQLQAADIFTKPFANSEKWKNAIKLLAITDKEIESKPQDKTARRPSSAAERAPCTGGPSALPDAKRLIIEICCSSESKLSDTDRKWAVGCTVLQFTEDNDLNIEENRKQIAKTVNEWDGDITPLAWISLPCTGGTPWTHINMRHPKAREKVLHHIRIFHKLWQSMLMFFDLVEIPVKIALEWPKGCRYWTLPKV